MADEVAGPGVGLFVALEELFEDLHRGVDRFVGFGVGLLDGERVVGYVNDGLEGLEMAVGAFLIDDELGADDRGGFAIGEFVGNSLEFGGDVLLDPLFCGVVANLNS